MRNKDILDKVIKAQEGFVYEKKVDVDDYQIWHCHKPGTRIYSFEIVFGKEGIYVNGDIDSVVWEHRTGLDFLAGRDVDYYIYSKLGNQYKDRLDVDEEAVDRFLAEQMVRWLYDDWEFSGDIPIPWEDPDQWSFDDFPSAAEVVELYEMHGLNDKEECNAWDLYIDITNQEHNDLHGICQTAFTYNGDYEYRFSKPAWGVMFCMYMACYAARKIKEQEDE